MTFEGNIITKASEYTALDLLTVYAIIGVVGVIYFTWKAIK